MLDRTILYTGWTRPEELLFVVGERSALEDAVSRRTYDLRWTRLGEFVERAALECGFVPAQREPPRQAPPAPALAQPAGPPRAVPPISPGGARQVFVPPRVVPGAARPATAGGVPQVSVPPQPCVPPTVVPSAPPQEPIRASRPAVPRIVLQQPAPAAPSFGPRPGG